MTSVLIVLFLLFLFLMNIPISFALGICSLVVLLVIDVQIPLEVIPQRMFTGTDSFTLIAIPFFLLAGSIMEKGGVSKRLINFSFTLVGSIKGGLAMITVLSSMFFSAVSGSGPAGAAAMGKMNIPTMIERGYHKSFASSLQATSSAIGVILPPSIVMILFSVVTGASVGQLFLAGIVPGILVGISLMIAGYIVARRRNYPTERRSTLKEVIKSFIDSIPALLMPAIILIGIFAGMVTPTESAVVAVLYGVIIGFFVYKELKLSDIPAILYEVALLTSMLIFLVATANIFAWLITSLQFPQDVAKLLSGISTNPNVVMLIIIAVFLTLGTFLDTSAAIIILTPVLLPIAEIANIDLIHFGVITVVALAIGLATPPVGLNLFVTTKIARIGIVETSIGLWPFLLAMIIVLFIIAYVPILVTFVPAIFG